MALFLLLFLLSRLLRLLLLNARFSTYRDRINIELYPPLVTRWSSAVQLITLFPTILVLRQIALTQLSTHWVDKYIAPRSLRLFATRSQCRIFTEARDHGKGSAEAAYVDPSVHLYMYVCGSSVPQVTIYRLSIRVAVRLSVCPFFIPILSHPPL